jgi:membrane protein involved in D-alanine export
VLTDGSLWVGFALYVLVARACLTLHGAWRLRLFAVANIGAVGALFYTNLHPRVYFLLAYVVFVVVHWALTGAWARRGKWGFALAVAFPLVVLGSVKYLPIWGRVLGALGAQPDPENAAVYFVGISYVAFRLSHLVVEVRNGAAEPPDVWSHLGFAFFPATMAMGPINAYSTHSRSLAAAKVASIPWREAAWRVFVGIVKYVFFANVFNQLSYAGLLADGHPHPRVDWLVSAVSYYFYLYCNFSGFCDVGIGIAAMLGITVSENFARPFAARNVRDFWNRWHITLSVYMRDMVFTPLSKALLRRWGPRAQNHALALSIFTVFILIGIWHGAKLNYLLFGVVHGVGVVTNHYWSLTIRRVLRPEWFRAYQKSILVHAGSVCLTFSFVVASLAIFANDKGIGRTLAFLTGVR